MLSHKKKSWLIGKSILHQTFNHLANSLLSKHCEFAAKQSATRVCSIISMKRVNPIQEIQTVVYVQLMFEAKLKFKFP